MNAPEQQTGASAGWLMAWGTAIIAGIASIVRAMITRKSDEKKHDDGGDELEEAATKTARREILAMRMTALELSHQHLEAGQQRLDAAIKTQADDCRSGFDRLEESIRRKHKQTCDEMDDRFRSVEQQIAARLAAIQRNTE